METRSLAAMKAALHDNDKGVRLNAAKQLAARPKDAKAVIPDLTQALFDGDGLVRFHACIAIGLVGEGARHAVSYLLRILRDTKEKTQLRRQAGQSLGLIGRVALPGLVDALGVRNKCGRACAIGGLHTALATLKSMPDLLEKANKGLVGLLGSTDCDLQFNAANLLGEIGQAADPFLMRAMEDASEIVRLNAARALLRSEPWHLCNRPIADAVLTRRFDDSMLRNESRAAIKALIVCLKSPLQSIQYNALCFLSEIDVYAKPAIKDIICMLGVKVEKIREKAAYVLGMIGRDARQAGAQLVKVLGDSNAEVRRTAAWALGQIIVKSPAAIDALLKALKDVDWEVQVSATCALGRIGPKPKLVIPFLADAKRKCPFEDKRAIFESVMRGIKNREEKVLS
jgi:HEAT repeat protein